MTNWATTGNGATTSASSTFSSEVSGNMIDGNSSTRWVSNTNLVTGQWGRIDLGQARTIVAARVNHTPAGYINAWLLESSTDDSAWTVRAGGTSPGDQVMNFSSVSARYWRVRYILDANQGNELADFELHDVSQSDTYLAATDYGSQTQKGFASASTGPFSSFVISNINDSNDSTIWVPNVNPMAGHWAAIAIRKPIPILKIRVKETTYTVGYKIQSSPDNTNWTDQATGLTGPSDTTTTLGAAVTAPFWRILYTSGSSGTEVASFELQTAPQTNFLLLGGL